MRAEGTSFAPTAHSGHNMSERAAASLADRWIEIPTTSGRSFTASLGSLAPNLLARMPGRGSRHLEGGRQAQRREPPRGRHQRRRRHTGLLPASERRFRAPRTLDSDEIESVLASDAPGHVWRPWTATAIRT